MGIWRRQVDAAAFDKFHKDTLPGLLGIRLHDIGEDVVTAEMPVDERHVQPYGILHGGGSVVLAETVGSFCSAMTVPQGQQAVGVEINASHLSAVRKGDRVTATCRPLRLGRTLQVWTIEIRRGDGAVTCVCRLTTAIRGERGI